MDWVFSLWKVIWGWRWCCQVAKRPTGTQSLRWKPPHVISKWSFRPRARNSSPFIGRFRVISDWGGSPPQSWHTFLSNSPKSQKYKFPLSYRLLPCTIPLCRNWSVLEEQWLKSKTNQRFIVKNLTFLAQFVTKACYRAYTNLKQLDIIAVLRFLK